MQTHTPVGYWTEMPVLELLEWFDVCDELTKEARAAADAEVEKITGKAVPRNG